MFTPPPMQIPVLNLRRDVSLVQVLCEEVKIFVGLLKNPKSKAFQPLALKRLPLHPRSLDIKRFMYKTCKIFSQWKKTNQIISKLLN